MSTHLGWAPIRPEMQTVSTAMKYALADELVHGDMPALNGVVLDHHVLSWLRGVALARGDASELGPDAQALIVAIEEYGSIRLCYPVA